MSAHIIGVDLGQFNDFTALSVIESEANTRTPVHQVRHLDRWRGRPYTDLTGTLAEVIAEVRTDKARPTLAIDQTGVGAAVVDQIRAANLDAELVSISIHGGDRVTRDGAVYRVPKRDLVGAVAVTLQSARLRISPHLALVTVLSEELSRFKVKIDPATAHDSYAAWRENDHDDCVLSVAMAVWLAEHRVKRRATPVAASSLLHITAWSGEERIGRPW